MTQRPPMPHLADNVGTVRFSVLGPLHASRHGHDVTPQSFKVRAVLALLLLRAGAPVDLATLLRRVWDSPPPATAVASARNTVSSLRRALAGSPGVTLETVDRGYRLVVSPASLDVTELTALVARGRALASADDPESAAASFRRAMELWRGPTLADLTLDGVRWTEIARLEQRRLELQEWWLAAELACGRHRRVLPELERLVRDHPEREELHRLRVVALHRSGRRGDASEAYARARQAVRTHQDRGPGQGLRDAHLALLSATPPRLASLALKSGPRGTRRANALVGRSDTGAPEPAMPREGAHLGVVPELRSVAVLCVRGPGPDNPADLVDGPAQRLWHTVREIVDDFGGVRQPQDDAVLVAYFGLHDPDPARPATIPAPERAAACALAVRAALL